MENWKFTFVDEDEDTHAHCYIDGNKDDGFLIRSFEGYDKSNDLTRRLCAAWNACEGIPTEVLEQERANSGFWADWLASKDGATLNRLREENAAIRAAVAEMARMLPVINEFEGHRPVTWDEVTNGTGVSTANAYRQTLEAALEIIKKP